MKEIINTLKPYRRGFLTVGFLHILATLCSLFMPYIMSSIVNDGIAEKNFTVILTRGAWMVGVALLALVCSLVTVRMNARISNGYTSSLQKAIFNKINSLRFEEFSKIGTSSLLTRCTDDIFEMREAVNMLIYAVVTVPIMFIGGIVLSFSGDPILALILLAMTPLVLVLIWLVTRNLGKLWQRSDDYIDIQNKLVRERLSGIRVIRAFNKEPFEHNRIADATQKMALYIIRANVRGGFVSPLAIFLMNLSTVAMLYVGALRIGGGAATTAGAVIATVQYAALIMNAILTMSWTIAWIPHLKVCVGRVAEVFSLDSTPALSSDPTRPLSDEPVTDGTVELSHVTFSYGSSEVPALQDITLSVRAGESVAVIGGTGSGKSTLCRLLLRFYEPQSGTITLGGTPYSRMTRRAVRDSLSVALQRSMVFEGTAAENIRMGCPDATDDTVWEAAGTSQIADYLHAQPDGLACRLAQSGTNISGGQKQRFNIARTIIKNAAVYIFDDSFSALDYLTEANLRRELNQKLQGKTQIIITQRAATAMRCDRVFVLDRGMLVGSGTHRELLESCPVYREIYDSQLGGDAQ